MKPKNIFVGNIKMYLNSIQLSLWKEPKDLTTLEVDAVLIKTGNQKYIRLNDINLFSYLILLLTNKDCFIDNSKTIPKIGVRFVDVKDGSFKPYFGENPDIKNISLLQLKREIR